MNQAVITFVGIMMFVQAQSVPLTYDVYFPSNQRPGTETKCDCKGTTPHKAFITVTEAAQSNDGWPGKSCGPNCLEYPLEEKGIVTIEGVSDSTAGVSYDQSKAVKIKQIDPYFEPLPADKMRANSEAVLHIGGGSLVSDHNSVGDTFTTLKFQPASNTLKISAQGHTITIPWSNHTEVKFSNWAKGMGPEHFFLHYRLADQHSFPCRAPSDPKEGHPKGTHGDCSNTTYP